MSQLHPRQIPYMFDALFSTKWTTVGVMFHQLPIWHLNPRPHFNVWEHNSVEVLCPCCSSVESLPQSMEWETWASAHIRELWAFRISIYTKKLRIQAQSKRLETTPKFRNTLSCYPQTALGWEQSRDWCKPAIAIALCQYMRWVLHICFPCIIHTSWGCTSQDIRGFNKHFKKYLTYS
jgi:hypothetical protein